MSPKISDLGQSILSFTIIVSGYTDAFSYKILNVVTFPAMAAGLLISYIEGGWKQFGINIFILLILYLFGMLGLMGMGDLKLLMAITALCGINRSLDILLAGLISTILYALLLNPSEVLFCLAGIFPLIRMILQTIPIKQKKNTITYGIPFGFFILIGYSIIRILEYA